MPTTSEPYSVCIASRNRLEQLQASFPTILAQHPPDVVFVDDGSTDGTEGWAASRRFFLEEMGSEFYYHNTGQQGYRRGSHGPPWNDAVVLAKHGNVVMQCAEVACLGEVYKELLQFVDDNTIALARCYAVPKDFPLPAVEEHAAFSGPNVLIEGTYRDPGLGHAANGLSVYCGHERAVPFIFCGAFKVALWERLGGYSETVLAAADAELAQRALQSGVRFQIVGTAVTFHLAHSKT